MQYIRRYEKRGFLTIWLEWHYLKITSFWLEWLWGSASVYNNVINENLKATFLTQAEQSVWGGGGLQTISKKWKPFKKNENFVLQK